MATWITRSGGAAGLALALVLGAGGCADDASGAHDAGALDARPALDAHPGRDAPAAADAGGDAGVVDIVEAIDRASAAIAAGETSVDLDGDGRAEYTRVLDGAGALTREEIDVDGDGVADIIWDFSGPTKTYWADDDGDGEPERTVEATADTPSPGMTSLVVTEARGPALVLDYRSSYAVDPTSDTLALRFEVDPDHDGTFDSAGGATVDRVQRDLTVPTMGPRACTSAQKVQIEQAYAGALRRGEGCLRGIAPRLATDLAHMAARDHIIIQCGSGMDCPSAGSAMPGTSIAGCHDSAESTHRYFGPSDEVIIIEPPGFASLDETIFHELMHMLLGVHQDADPRADPADRVYGCERACFGAMPTSQDCAACLGTTNDDTRCSGFTRKPCTDNPQYCICRGHERVYPSPATCMAGCPSGFRCFTSYRCRPRGPCGT